MKVRDVRLVGPVLAATVTILSVTFPWSVQGAEVIASPQELQTINKLRTDALAVGQAVPITNSEANPSSIKLAGVYPATATQGAEVPQYYTVRPGDTLFFIGQRFNVTIAALRQANNIWDDYLVVGQRIIIPSATKSGSAENWEYTVRPGDTLFLIAQRYNTTITALRQLNNIWNDYLSIGQRLLIPSTAVTMPKQMTLIASDYDLLARLVTAEAAGEPFEGQVAVAATIISRVLDSRYPNDVRGVIYQVINGYYQYEPVQNGYINRPAVPSAFSAVDAALAGKDPSNGANGFFNPQTAVGSWVRSQPVTAQIGNHVFFRS